MPEETLKELTDRHDYIAKKNAERVGALRQEGIALNSQSILMQRIDYILEVLVGDDGSPERVRFEIEWQERIAAGLDRLEKDARKAKREARLAVPHPGKQTPGGLIMPGGQQ